VVVKCPLVGKNINCKSSKAKYTGKYLELRRMKQVEGLRCYITRNFVIYTGHVVLLE